jgi:hypothetical protein
VDWEKALLWLKTKTSAELAPEQADQPRPLDWGRPADTDNPQLCVSSAFLDVSLDHGS